MVDRTPISLWDASAEEPDYAAPLDGDAEADVAIVGGGFTGLSTALHAAEKGLAAHVLEAEHIGHGDQQRPRIRHDGIFQRRRRVRYGHQVAAQGFRQRADQGDEFFPQQARHQPLQHRPADLVQQGQAYTGGHAIAFR